MMNEKDQQLIAGKGITEPMTFKLTDTKGTSAQSLVFECTEEDPDKVVPFLKGTLKKSELGAIMMFRVTPHGQYMWIPRRS